MKHYKKKIKKDNKIRQGSIVYLDGIEHKKVTVDGFSIDGRVVYIRYGGHDNGYRCVYCSRTPGGPMLKLEDLDLSDKYIICKC